MKGPYYIIGGGIIGSSIAREILFKGIGEVTVLEKEESLGKHASGRNSGVFHSGISHIRDKDSFKVKLCKEGNAESIKYCNERKIKIETCGKLIIAKREDQNQRLEDLLRKAQAAEIPGVRILTEKEVELREPNIKCYKAIFSPTDSIVDSMSFLNSVAEDAISLGAQYEFNQEVKKITDNKIITNNKEFLYGTLINCAGLYSDKIAHNMGLGLKYKIIPFRGDYKKIDTKINSMVYQIPDPEFPFLKVHLTKTVEDYVLAGPTSTWSWGGREFYNWSDFDFKELCEQIVCSNFWKLIKSKKFKDLVWENASTSLFKSRFMSEINDLINVPISSSGISNYRSGIRAQMVDKGGNMVDDVLIEKSHNSIHILNAISPGMTYALPFARYFVREYLLPETSEISLNTPQQSF